jgi:hypothetical protein
MGKLVEHRRSLMHGTQKLLRGNVKKPGGILKQLLAANVIVSELLRNFSADIFLMAVGAADHRDNSHD